MKIVIIDDHDIFRQSISFLIKECSEHEVVAHSAHLEDLQDFIKTHSADCVLLDYHMPRATPVAAFQSLRARYAHVKFAFLTGSRSASVLRQICQCGATGVAHKQDDSDVLLAMLEALNSGQSFISPTVLELTSHSADVFTKRELDVLYHLVHGQTPAEISELLNISTRTVEKHKENMMKKIEAKSVAQLIDFGHQLQLSEFESET